MGKRNLFSAKQYDEVKNNKYVVISFGMDTQTREMSFTGLSMYRAVKVLQREQAKGRVVMIVTEEQSRVIHKCENKFIIRVSISEALAAIKELECIKSLAAETA